MKTEMSPKATPPITDPIRPYLAALKSAQDHALADLIRQASLASGKGQGLAGLSASDTDLLAKHALRELGVRGSRALLDDLNFPR